jgi:CspA family cold shock protein
MSNEKEARRINGTIKWWDRKRGFGFISVENASTDVFLHHRALANASMGADLVQGDRVTFELVESDKGPKAVAVRLSNPDQS